MLDILAIILAVVGVLDAFYLTLAHYGLVKIAGGKYEAVHKSSHAEIFRIPVAAIGMAGYGALLACMIGAIIWPEWRRYWLIVQLGMSAIGFAFSVRLIYVSIFRIKKLCPFCVVSALTMTGILLITLMQVTRGGT